MVEQCANVVKTEPIVTNLLPINPDKALVKAPESVHSLLTTLSHAARQLSMMTKGSHQMNQHGPPAARPAALATGTVAALALARCGGGASSPAAAAAASGEKPIVGLITKTDTNPFFVKMKEGAQQAADKARASSCRPSPASRTATTRPRCRRSRT